MHQKEKCKSLLFMIIIGLLVAILILVYIYIYFRDEVFRRKYILDDSKGNIIQVQTQYPVLGGGGQVFLTYNENGRCVFKKEWIN